jgi:hypothetical protein
LRIILTIYITKGRHGKIYRAEKEYEVPNWYVPITDSEFLHGELEFTIKKAVFDYKRCAWILYNESNESNSYTETDEDFDFEMQITKEHGFILKTR